MLYSLLQLLGHLHIVHALHIHCLSVNAVEEVFLQAANKEMHITFCISLKIEEDGRMFGSNDYQWWRFAINIWFIGDEEKVLNGRFISPPSR